jgi:diguanylate cyclase (GGDEF)-like protein
MTRAMTCPSCGATTGIPACPACGGDLLGATAEWVSDRAAGDREQSLSDRDQTSSDRDQEASESDQRSADEDQLAADGEFAAGGDEVSHLRGAQARERSSRDRDAVSVSRDESAAARLRTTEDRDRAAELRDSVAEDRDAKARLHDLMQDATTSREDILLQAADDRARAAADRARAAEDRAQAAADREEAARERAEALRLRTESADNLKLAATDELTGAQTRKFGLEEVARELGRARRTGATLAVAFGDVDGLKRINDTQGHLAGDALLRLVGETLRANLRPYDVIVRYGGDEFVCAMPDFSVPEARGRFERIAAAVAATGAGHSVTFGVAEAGPNDSLQELLARADADLLAVRRTRISSD